MKENTKKNNLPIVGKIQDVNDEFNRAFRDEVFMPMIKFAVTLLFIVVVLDFGFQLIEAVDVLKVNKLFGTESEMIDSTLFNHDSL